MTTLDPPNSDDEKDQDTENTPRYPIEFIDMHFYKESRMLKNIFAAATFVVVTALIYLLLESLFKNIGGMYVTAVCFVVFAITYKATMLNPDRNLADKVVIRSPGEIEVFSVGPVNIAQSWCFSVRDIQLMQERFPVLPSWDGFYIYTAEQRFAILMGKDKSMRLITALNQERARLY